MELLHTSKILVSSYMNHTWLPTSLSSTDEYVCTLCAHVCVCAFLLEPRVSDVWYRVRVMLLLARFPSVCTLSLFTFTHMRKHVCHLVQNNLGQRERLATLTRLSLGVGVHVATPTLECNQGNWWMRLPELTNPALPEMEV